MIYLIDDNQFKQREMQYGIDYIENKIYSDYLISIEKIEKKDIAGDVSHLDFLKDASCILLHTTTEDVDDHGEYIKGSTTNVTKIIDEISDSGQNVPLVLFSNGMNDGADYDFRNNPSLIRSVKKNRFYARLGYFIEEYIKTGIVEFRILAYGKNYLVEELGQYADKLTHPLAFSKPDKKLSVSDINIKAFSSFVGISFPDNDWKEMLNGLEDNPVSVEEFIGMIVKIVESFHNYGKNIHHWF